MNINNYDYVEPKGVDGKIILTHFPGRSGEEKLFNYKIFIEELKTFNQLRCGAIVSLVEDTEFEKICDKKLFVREIYNKNLSWFHLPIIDLKSPKHKFIDKWQTTKSRLKNELVDGNNIVIHCMGGKGRSGTITAILLVEFGVSNKEAIDIVRKQRKGAIETTEQEDFILSYRINS